MPLSRRRWLGWLFALSFSSHAWAATNLPYGQVVSGTIACTENGNARFSGDGERARAASLNIDIVGMGIAPDSAGNTFSADTGNNRIRKVTPRRDDHHRSGQRGLV